MRGISLIMIFVPGLIFSQEINVYLVGDGGDTKFKKTIDLLEQTVGRASKNDILVFLGGNVYPKGLPIPESPGRADREKELIQQLDLIKKFKGRAYVIPGEQDWNGGGKDGWKYVRYQQKFISEYLGDPEVFQPKGGCPGPVEIEISDEVVMIIVDTQYLLHPWLKPRKEDGCEISSSLEVLDLLADAVERNRNKHVIVAGHHPVLSNGHFGTAIGLNNQKQEKPLFKEFHFFHFFQFLNRIVSKNVIDVYLRILNSSLNQLHFHLKVNMKLLPV